MPVCACVRRFNVLIQGLSLLVSVDRMRYQLVLVSCLLVLSTDESYGLTFQKCCLIYKIVAPCLGGERREIVVTAHHNTLEVKLCAEKPSAMDLATEVRSPGLPEYRDARGLGVSGLFPHTNLRFH